MRLPDALKALGLCCGSSAWCFRMASGRPYPNRAELLRFSELKFRSMTKQEWIEAFAHHTPVLKKLENRGLLNDELRTEFETACRRYERRFGHQFVVHLDGQNPLDILTQLKRRTGYDPYDELSVAADQQSRITADRLINLLDQLAKDVDEVRPLAPAQSDYVKARGLAAQTEAKKSA